MLKGWRKKEVQRAIFLRDSDPANQGIDFTRVEELWDRCGVIYGLYHFTSGRWYVGQTKKRAWARFQEHWYSRKRLPDLLHEALALEQDPFCVTLIPLEFIDQHIWLQSTTAQEQTRLFRNAATPREQYWTDKLQSMWPKGWNAAWPGQPAPKRAKRAPQRVLHIDPSDAQELYQGLVDGIGSNAQETLDKIRNLEFSTARKIVQWKMKQGTRVQSCSRPGEAEVEAALRQRVKDKPKERSRQFIKFLYGSNDAWHLHIRDVLRNGSIHSLHPEPNVAAALRVCERYAPQVQSLLFNYTSAAREASSEDAVIDLQQPCACWQALRSRDANDRYLHEGHVCTTDLTALKCKGLRIKEGSSVWSYR